MAMKEATDTGNQIRFKFDNKGDKLVGYYVKTTEEVINGTPAKKHHFVTEQGVTTVLGQANLYRQLTDNGCLGMKVEIVFTGNVEKLKGGRSMKVYKVRFDDSDTFNGNYDSNEVDTDAIGADEEDNENPVDEIEVAQPTKPARPAAEAPSSERRNQFQQLLKARK